MANTLTYEDYKRRISISDLLEDAGYSYNKRDGLRYPSYSRKDADGKNIKGDKFIVTANGLCCFRPPEMRNYNVISFIKEHPGMFTDYTPGMNLDALVNRICCRLLNEPYIANRKNLLPQDSITAEKKDFQIDAYTVESWKDGVWDTQKPFFSYFKGRGLTRETQRAFADNFFISSNNEAGEIALRNLSFPLRIPGSAKIVGLELRGIPNKETGESYKGMAAQSNRREGVWLSSPKVDVTDVNELKRVKDVYWFESAYDAMAFYQLHAVPLSEQLEKAQIPSHSYVGTASINQSLDRYTHAVYVSTGGSPTNNQMRNMLMATSNATHHLCFDRDMAGQLFALRFALVKAGKDYEMHIATPKDVQECLANKDQLLVRDLSKLTKEPAYRLNAQPFEFGRLSYILGASCPNMQSYLDTLHDRSDIKSGNFKTLPNDSMSSRLYGEFITKSKELKEGTVFIDHPSEDHGDIRRKCETEIQEISQRFTDALYKEVSAYRKGGGNIEYQPCKVGFKDYNDELLNKTVSYKDNLQDDKDEQSEDNDNKKQMTSESIIKSSLDGTDGIYEERSESHEEKERRDSDNRNSHYRR